MNKKRSRKFDDRFKVCIICEGSEEERYIKRLSDLKVWHENYNVIPVDAHSIDKIFAKYKYEFQSDKYDIVLVMCDTETAPYEQFKTLKRKLDDFHARDATKHILFYTNPCTMQLILLHFDEVRLKTTDKSSIARSHLQKYFGLGEYHARDKELDIIMRKINAENYEQLKVRLKDIPSSAENIPGTNFLDLLTLLGSPDAKWIKNINDDL